MNKMGAWTVNTVHNVDTVEGLTALPNQCIASCITSPPYWNQRNYDMPGQYGQEPTPELYITQLVKVFKEVYRVLKNNGTLWLNLGDAYWGSGKAGNDPACHERQVQLGRKVPLGRIGKPTGYSHPHLKKKDLVGLPWQVAFALQKEGWYLRQDIIWSKKNCMPESVKDRCTKSHEYLFLLSKSEKYFFDYKAIQQPLKTSSLQRLTQNVGDQQGSSRVPGKTNGPMKAVGHVIGGSKHQHFHPGDGHFALRNNKGSSWQNADGKANKRSVWTIPTQPFKDNHFATFPIELAATCIKAGSRTGDLILDPFMGAGTTAIAAMQLERAFLGFELNPAYVAMCNKRIHRKGKLFHPND